MFNICYAKKKKSIINEKTKEAMLQLQEREEKNEDSSKEKTMNDSFSEIMGGEKYGSIRMFRFDVCPFDVWKDKSTWKMSQNKYVAALELKVDDLESQLENLQTMLNNQNNGNTLDRGDITTSSNLV
ncbi:uncharacterized protein LOC115724912 isoform X2 [Cannabis sativa]|uniref:uncharacterized protein LOC115724912 isoform X2 n=1 Tax=Cannabis sativa TaxID=3483 RepID=UPI0029CA956C|nr:uncharacterized protein LOC115724912 isoform X2 [Cannabis sativa]